MNNTRLLLYIAVMAGVTYLIRMIPLALVKGKIESRFVKSFLYYVPYAVLSAMTIPAIFSSTASGLSALIGFAVAVITAYVSGSLLGVALTACGAVLITEILMLLIG